MRLYDVTLFENYLCADVKSHMYYRGLNEATQDKLNKDLVNKIFKSTKNKYLSLDYFGIEATKGDITTFKYYSYIVDSIKYIEIIYNKDPSNSPNEILWLQRTLDILTKNKQHWKQAFITKNELLCMLYTNITANLITCLSKTVTISMDYVKDNSSKTFTEVFKGKKALAKDVSFKNLKRILDLDSKGDLNKLFKNVEKTKVFTEDSNILNEELEGLGIIILAVIGVVIAIRWIVFYYYRIRTMWSEHILALAYFLEQHANKMKSDGDMGEDVYNKQIEKVAKLKRLGEKISAKDKNAEKEIEKDIDQDDKNNQMSNDETDDDDVLL